MKIILDNGHSGLVNGEYTTPGKRMVWDDFTFYEGVWNREVVNKLIKLCEFHGIDYHNLVPEQDDISLPKRCERVNEIYRTNKDCLLLSIHANGFKKESANGYETWVYRNASQKSRDYAKVIHRNYLEVNKLRDRGIKESGFYILKNTNCPAVMYEAGFYTNREECLYLINEQDSVVEGVFNGILEITKGSRKESK